jgi:hypothetical protein
MLSEVKREYATARATPRRPTNFRQNEAWQE